MARSSETRQRVRAAALQLIAAGTEPTPTVIRGMLGEGSNSTIVSELKAMRKEREAGGVKPLVSGESTAEALSRVGAQEAAELVRKAAETSMQLRETTSLLNGTASALKTSIDSLHSIPREFAELKKTMLEVIELMRTDRAWMEAELNRAYERYKGAQVYALREIEAAREETRKAKEQARAGDGSYEQMMAYMRQNDALRNLVAQLNGRLQERTGQPSDIALPPPVGLNAVLSSKLTS